MTTIQLLIVCLTVLLIVFAIVGARYQRPGAATADGTVFENLRPAQQIAIHTGPGQLIKGAVESVNDNAIVLTGAALVANAGAEVSMGTVRVAISEATVVQELSPVREDVASS